MNQCAPQGQPCGNRSPPGSTPCGGAALTAALAASEASRFEGPVLLPAGQVLCLRGLAGPHTFRLIPLRWLTPAWANAAQDAVVDPAGGEITRLRRGPLHRVGLTLQSGLMVGRMPRFRGVDAQLGTGASVFAGGHFSNAVGFGLRMDLLGAPTFVGPVPTYAAASAELQLMPVTHLGLYAGAGLAMVSNQHPLAGPTDSALMFRGGTQAEFGLAPRVSLHLRVGIAGVTGLSSAAPQLLSEALVGLGVY